MTTSSPSQPNDYLAATSIAALRRRAALISRLRDFFDQRSFFEVETPLLSADTVVDRHLHPIEIDRGSVTVSEHDLGNPVFLQTSPEFAMKRLLASGADAIYQICKAFRRGELGRMHNPEFTMLEWYRVGDSLQDGMNLLAELVQNVLGLPTARHVTYREAMIQYGGIDFVEASSAELSRRSGLAEQLDRDEHLNVILAKEVEPLLGHESPVLLYDYPASQAALARIRHEGKTAYAERFEIYVRGVELANGYHELLDAGELLQRNQQVNHQRIRDGQQELPTDSRLSAAMRHGLPACAGVALGVDRLFMLAEKSESIAAGIAFPFPRA